MSVILEKLTINSQSQNKLNLVEKLETAKNALLTRAEQAGFQWGIKSTPTLSYKEMRRIALCDQKLNLHLDGDAFDSLVTFLESHSISLDKEQLELASVSATSQESFVNGWMEGVLFAVWNGMTGR